MPEFYSDAARLLFMLTRLGLTFGPGVDARDVVHRLAVLMEKYVRKKISISHAGAATWIIDDLLKQRHVTIDPAERAKIIAMIGTCLGNIQMTCRAA